MMKTVSTIKYCDITALFGDTMKVKTHGVEAQGFIVFYVRLAHKVRKCELSPNDPLIAP